MTLKIFIYDMMSCCGTKNEPFCYIILWLKINLASFLLQCKISMLLVFHGGWKAVNPSFLLNDSSKDSFSCWENEGCDNFFFSAIFNSTLLDFARSWLKKNLFLIITFLETDYVIQCRRKINLFRCYIFPSSGDRDVFRSKSG